MLVKKEKILIGRRETARLPDFGLENVHVKIDTGAYTYSIHVSYCKENNGRLEVVFLDDKHSGFNPEHLFFDDFRIRKVKSSTGVVQSRYFIFGQIFIAGLLIQTEFSLTERKDMRFPILIGRKLLNKHFIVETSKKYTYPKKIK
jgi:hypothetical protein